MRRYIEVGAVSRMILLQPRTRRAVCKTGCSATGADDDRGPVAADRADSDRLLVGENAGEVVEIRQSRMVVVGIAGARNRLTELIFRKTKGTRAHDVLLEPARVAIENLLLV